MVCEIPVIGSDSGEIPNVIGDAGLISNEGDAADLAKKLKIVLTDRELRESLAKKGKERVLANYTQKKVAEATFLVYKNLMST